MAQILDPLGGGRRGDQRRECGGDRKKGAKHRIGPHQNGLMTWKKRLSHP